MAKINPNRSWLELEARAREVTSPRQKAMLNKVRDHMYHEISGHLEETLATLSPHPTYHFWGNNPSVIHGQAAVRAFYSNLIAAGANQFEVVIEKIVVDDDNVVTEGRVRQVYTGREVAAMGVREINGQAVAPDGLYLTSTQLITVWPADVNGQLIGEDVYLCSDPFADCERITAADLPEGFRYEHRL